MEEEVRELVGEAQPTAAGPDGQPVGARSGAIAS